MLDQYLSDKGGIDHVSAVTYALCRLAASLGTEREIMEGKLSLDQFGRLAGHERRVLESLGSERIPRPINDGSAALVDYFSHPRPKTPCVD